MVLAKPAKTNPRALAEKIVAQLTELDEVTSAELAGPGFITLRMNDSVWLDELATIAVEYSAGLPVMPATLMVWCSDVRLLSADVAPLAHAIAAAATDWIAGNSFPTMFRRPPSTPHSASAAEPAAPITHASVIALKYDMLRVSLMVTPHHWRRLIFLAGRCLVHACPARIAFMQSNPSTL